jgi:hypothetical protein
MSTLCTCENFGFFSFVGIKPTIFNWLPENILYFCSPKIAQVAELVDALDSKSSDFGRVGSIPTLSTVKLIKNPVNL